MSHQNKYLCGNWKKLEFYQAFLHNKNHLPGTSVKNLKKIFLRNFIFSTSLFEAFVTLSYLWKFSDIYIVEIFSCHNFWDYSKVMFKIRLYHWAYSMQWQKWKISIKMFLWTFLRNDSLSLFYSEIK